MSVLFPTVCRRAHSSILFNVKHRYISSRNFVLFSTDNYYSSHFSRPTDKNVLKLNKYSVAPACVRNLSNDVQNPEKPPKLGLVAQFKQMYKDYWYVLVPVHLVTSAIWFGAFYYVAKR